jgi:DNA replication protein DnaC
MMIDDLESLLKELGCKTPAQEIPADHRDRVIGFLKTEIEYRRQYKIKRLLCNSGIKHVKTLEQFDWHFNPKISKDDIMTFVHSPWVENASNLVLICYEALLRGYPAACITAFDLVSRIHKAYNPSSKIEYYAKVRVLCIDELGYTYHKKEDTDILFQIISKRNEILPTIVTSNLSPKDWGSIFSATAASAILDRLSFNGTFITLEGRSYRLLRKHKTR